MRRGIQVSFNNNRFNLCQSWCRTGLRLGIVAVLSLVVAACDGVGTKGDEVPGEESVELNIGMAYIKRSLPTIEDEDDPGVFLPAEQDLRMPAAFHPGAHLYYRASASIEAEEINITERLFPGEEIDVKDLEVSHDGEYLLFALRAPADPNADEDNQPTWNIWEYEIATDTLQRVISDAVTAESGEDIAPHYLGDGRIVFSSSRQKEAKARRVDAVPNGPYTGAWVEESRDTTDAFDNELLVSEQEVFSLHILSEDRAQISQLTFGFSHDFDPVVMDDGSIIFSRWHNHANASQAGIHLYRINPNGTGLSLVYGADSHSTGTAGGEVHFANARVQRDGRILAMVREFGSATLAGSYELIDVENYVDFDQRLDGSAGIGQTPIFSGVRTDDILGREGLFSAVYPLWDGSGRILASWATCQIVSGDEVQPCAANTTIDPIATGQPLTFGLWIFDPQENTQRPVLQPEPDVIYSDLVAVASRPQPDDGPRGVIDSDSSTDRMAVVHIRSVYDVDGVDTSTAGIAATRNPGNPAYDTRERWFVRFTKMVPRVDDDEFEFQDFPNDNATMQEMLGYAQVEPDGSVKVQIPADLPYSFSILNAQGERVTDRHPVWLQHREGEVVECVGCHDSANDVPHGRIDAGPDSANPGAPLNNLAFPGTNGAILAMLGESMAEAYWRTQEEMRASNVNHPLPRVSADLSYEEHWRDDTSSNFSLSYSEVFGASGVVPISGPTSEQCVTDMSADCRVVINYITHIEPLWSADRQVIVNDVLVADNTCITCHTLREADGITPKVPAGQLNLLADPAFADQDPYLDLTQNDTQRELDDNGRLVEVMVRDDNQPYELDPVTGELVLEVSTTGPCELDSEGNSLQATDPDTGDLLVDDMGNPLCRVERFITVQETRSMVLGRALSNYNPGGFLNIMTGIDVDTVDHSGMMSDAELRLIREWLDIGGQYYNSILDAVEPD